MDEKQIQEAFLQFLAQKSGAKNQKELEKYVQSLGEDGLKQAYMEFQKILQSQTQKAAHGAKLDYFRKLKNQCPEGEELYYYKKGGSVGCGCKKKEDGGEVVKAQNGAVTKFKNRTKAEQDKINKQSEDDYFNGTADHTKPGTSQKPIQKFKTRSKAEQERINKQSEKDYFAGTADHTKPGVKKVSKKACGSKIKKDCNRAVVKFKAKCGSKLKKHQQGGNLNGLLYAQKGGLVDATTKMIPIYGTYKEGQEFLDNPTWEGAAELGVSALGDLALVTGVGAGAGLALKAAKAAKAAKTARGISSATRAAKAKKAKRYYDASTQAFDDTTILYGGSAAIKANKNKK